MRVDDLAPLIARQPSPGVRYRQGTVIAWDPITAENVIAVGGAIVTNLPSLNASEVAVIRPGDQVSIQSLGRGVKTWFVVGRMTIPGGAESAIVQSFDYEPGIAGYTVNRDGFAEFQDITARGDLQVNSLLAGTPGGARVELTPTNFLQVYDASNVLVAELNADRLRVYGDNGSQAALIPDLVSGANQLAAVVFNPGTPTAPHTIGSLGAIYTLLGGGTVPQMTIVSPQINTEAQAQIQLFSGDPVDPNSFANVSASKVTLSGSVSVRLSSPAAEVTGDLTVQGDLAVDGFGWTSFSPKVYSGGGTTQVTGTVSYAKYRQLGKVVWAMVTVTFGANAAGGAAIDLPVPAAFRSLDCGSCALFGSGVPSTQCGAAVMTSSLDKLVITSFTGGFLDATSGQNIRYSICYEAA